MTALPARVADRFGGAYWAVRTRSTRLGERLIENSGRGETRAHVPLAELGLGHPERVDYIPSGWRFLHRALRGRRIGREDVFVDFGSGKGRVVCQAARRYPFGRVVGVELSEELNQVARANVQRARARMRCRDVEVVTCDATSYEVPDNMTYAYFFNPFGGEVLAAVIANIVDSLDRSPRELTLIYANPTGTACIEDSGRFELISHTQGRRDWQAISVYRSRR